MTNGNASAEQRKLAAIVLTDMVGYGAVAQRNDKLALELLEEHRQLYAYAKNGERDKALKR